jgi:hypothetical protein
MYYATRVLKLRPFPTRSGFWILAFAAVIRPILSSKLLFASYKAELLLCSAFPIPPDVIAKLLPQSVTFLI